MGTKDWKDAREDFKAVLELDPKNKTAKNQLTIAEHHLKQEREKEKKLYANMFAKKAADEPAVRFITPALTTTSIFGLTVGCYITDAN